MLPLGVGGIRNDDDDDEQMMYAIAAYYGGMFSEWRSVLASWFEGD